VHHFGTKRILIYFGGVNLYYDTLDNSAAEAP
jgi:hypothetical protein